MIDLRHWKDLWVIKGLNISTIPNSPMISVNGVRGFLIEGDVQLLWNLGQWLPVGGTYLEIGSWMGLSSIIVANSLLAKLNFGAKIFCVDTWEGSPEHKEIQEILEGTLYDTFLANLSRAKVGGFIHPCRGPSIEVAKKFDDHSLDLVFIDGDHSSEACYADLCAWFPKVKPQGRLLGHDAVKGLGVDEAINRFTKERGLHFTVAEPPAAHYTFEIFF